MENGFNDNSSLVLLMVDSQIEIVECRGGRDASLSRADESGLSITKLSMQKTFDSLTCFRPESCFR